MRQLKRTVKIGNITIGGTNPIAVQTMLNVPVKDIAGNVEQAKRVAKAGCLLHVARNILNGHIEHGLHCNGVGAANGNVADFDRPF